MVRDKIDSGIGRLWVRLLVAFVQVMDWMQGSPSKSRPSPLKHFTVEGT